MAEIPEWDATTAAAAASRMTDRGERLLVMQDLCDGAGTIREALATVGGVWPMATLAALHGRTARYSEIKRSIHGINDAMLTQTLRRFVRDGIAEQVTVEGARRPAYRLTSMGDRVNAVVGEFTWQFMALAPEVAAARERYDAEHG